MAFPTYDNRKARHYVTLARKYAIEEIEQLRSIEEELRILASLFDGYDNLEARQLAEILESNTQEKEQALESLELKIDQLLEELNAFIESFVKKFGAEDFVIHNLRNFISVHKKIRTEIDKIIKGINKILSPKRGRVDIENVRYWISLLLEFIDYSFHFINELEQENQIIADKRMRLNGFIIPEAYTPLNEWREKHGKEPQREVLRRFPSSDFNKRSAYFVVDKRNRSYKKLLSKFQTDTKELTNGLRKVESTYADKGSNRIDFYKGGDGRDVDKGRKVRIILAPLFLSSELTSSEKARINTPWEDEAIDKFKLHFDEAFKLQIIRMIEDKSPFRDDVKGVMLENGGELERSYGDWDAMAGILVPILRSADERFPKGK